METLIIIYRDMWIRIDNGWANPNQNKSFTGFSKDYLFLLMIKRKIFLGLSFQPWFYCDDWDEKLFSIHWSKGFLIILI